jgi:hypothetical protein
MREQLLGFLLDALEPEERQQVESELQQDAQLQRDLELLDECLEPLRAVDVPIEPPANLAARTCALIERKGRDVAQPALHSYAPLSGAASEVSFCANRMTLADTVVAAGIGLAAALLLFPAIQYSREAALCNGCKNKLREIGIATAEYCQMHDDYLPSIPPGATAGIYAVYLQDGEYIDGEGWNHCPGAALRSPCRAVYIPSFDELEQARGETLINYQRSMGGDYASTLHYVEGGRFRCRTNRGCSMLPIMADVPGTISGALRSTSHGGCGQNVLHMDGHVRFINNCTRDGCLDNFFLNDLGLVAAGTHINDAVIGHSAARPLVGLVAGTRDAHQRIPTGRADAAR